jgi:hypothetical protein
VYIEVDRSHARLEDSDSMLMSTKLDLQAARVAKEDKHTADDPTL